MTDTMNRYPMTPSIARREYRFTESGAASQIIVQLGTPSPLTDAPHGDWYCPWTIDGPGRSTLNHAGGVDSLQALLLALSGLRAELEHLARNGQLDWPGGGLGLDLVGLPG